MIRGKHAARLAALAGMALLGACATAEKVVTPVTDISGRECAATPDLSKAAALAFKPKDETAQTVDIAATGTTPCIKTAGGPAFYVAYALPQTDANYVIGVDSAAQGMTMFAPHVMLLGADGSVKREYSAATMEFRRQGIGISMRNHAGESYLVVASDPTAVGKSELRINEATQVYYGSVGAGTYQVHTGSESEDKYVYAHNGRLVVTITPIDPPK
jgi:hypothetical protein